MKDIKAFPAVIEDQSKPFLYEEGMDLRDYFAIHAGMDDLLPYLDKAVQEHNEGKDFLDHIGVGDIIENSKAICKARYQFADDLIEARGE